MRSTLFPADRLFRVDANAQGAMAILCFATRKRNEAWNPGNFGYRGLLVLGPAAASLRITPRNVFLPEEGLDLPLAPLSALPRLPGESSSSGYLTVAFLGTRPGQSPSSMRLRMFPSGSLNHVVLKPPSPT